MVVDSVCDMEGAQMGAERVKTTISDLCDLYLPKHFPGVGVDERPPDRTTLTAFKNRVLENGKPSALEGLLSYIIQLAHGPEAQRKPCLR